MGVLQSTEKPVKCLSHGKWYIPGVKQTTLRTAYHFSLLVHNWGTRAVYATTELRTCWPASNTWLQARSVWNRQSPLPNLFLNQLRTYSIHKSARNAERLKAHYRNASSPDRSIRNWTAKKRSHRQGPRMNKVVFYKTMFLVVVFYRRPRWRGEGVHKTVLKYAAVHVEVGHSWREAVIQIQKC